MRIVGFLFLLLVFTAVLASAQGQITHDALTCMSTDEFPVVEAELERADLEDVENARVYFRALGTDAWYFVEMAPEEDSRLRALLPKPLAGTNRVEYYVFMIRSSFEPWQTEEYSVYVAESGCGGVRAAAPGALTLHATIANQTPVPPGFQPGGISGLVTTGGNTVGVGSAAAGGGAASGGVSGVTLGAVAAGGAAAAAGAVMVTGSSEDDDGEASTTNAGPPLGGEPTSTTPAPSPAPAPTPSPEPSPTPSTLDVSGTWILDSRLAESCEPSLLGRTTRTGMEVQQNGTVLTASRVSTNAREDLTGTIDTAGNISMSGSFVDEGEQAESQWNATTTDGEDMNGTYTHFYPAFDCTLRWTFSGFKGTP